jgi:hypothetical protein
LERVGRCQGDRFGFDEVGELGDDGLVVEVGEVRRRWGGPAWVGYVCPGLVVGVGGLRDESVVVVVVVVVVGGVVLVWQFSLIFVFIDVSGSRFVRDEGAAGQALDYQPAH